MRRRRESLRHRLEHLIDDAELFEGPLPGDLMVQQSESRLRHRGASAFPSLCLDSGGAFATLATVEERVGGHVEITFDRRRVVKRLLRVVNVLDVGVLAGDSLLLLVTLVRIHALGSAFFTAISPQSAAALNILLR